MRLYDEDGNFSRDIEWTLGYNDLNQLTKRYVGTSWSVGTHRIAYEYDANGNLIGSVEETYGGVWGVSEEWRYDWNPRDQMTRAMKWAGSSGSTNNVGSVEYQYCLACDGALSKRFVYAGGSGASRGALQSGQRYEYDGLNLLRVDEIYGSTLSESGPWRTVEITTHQPGQLAALLHKRVYKYSSATSGTPSQTKDFTYSYDPVGNVYSVFDANGAEAYYFTQDAFGNELPIATLGGDNWNAARADRIVEHQTGKWIDAFTGLYYFWARWYDSAVGRFVGPDASKAHKLSRSFAFAHNDPVQYVDPDGRAPVNGQSSGEISIVIGDMKNGKKSGCCGGIPTTDKDTLLARFAAWQAKFLLHLTYPHARIFIKNKASKGEVLTDLDNKSTIGMLYIGHGFCDGLAITEEEVISGVEFRNRGIDLQFLITIACEAGCNNGQMGDQANAGYFYGPEGKVESILMSTYVNHSIDGLTSLVGPFIPNTNKGTDCVEGCQ